MKALVLVSAGLVSAFSLNSFSPRGRVPDLVRNIGNATDTSTKIEQAGTFSLPKLFIRAKTRHPKTAPPPKPAPEAAVQENVVKAPAKSSPEKDVAKAPSQPSAPKNAPNAAQKATAQDDKVKALSKSSALKDTLKTASESNSASKSKTPSKAKAPSKGKTQSKNKTSSKGKTPSKSKGPSKGKNPSKSKNASKNNPTSKTAGKGSKAASRSKTPARSKSKSPIKDASKSKSKATGRAKSTTGPKGKSHRKGIKAKNDATSKSKGKATKTPKQKSEGGTKSKGINASKVGDKSFGKSSKTSGLKAAGKGSKYPGKQGSNSKSRGSKNAAGKDKGSAGRKNSKSRNKGSKHKANTKTKGTGLCKRSGEGCNFEQYLREEAGDSEGNYSGWSSVSSSESSSESSHSEDDYSSSESDEPIPKRKAKGGRKKAAATKSQSAKSQSAKSQGASSVGNEKKPKKSRLSDTATTPSIKLKGPKAREEERKQHFTTKPPQNMDEVTSIEKGGEIPMYLGSYSQLEGNNPHEMTHFQMSGAVKIPKSLTPAEFNEVVFNTIKHTKNEFKHGIPRDSRPHDLTVDRHSIDGDSEFDLAVASTSAYRNKDKGGKFQMIPELEEEVKPRHRAKAAKEQAVGGKGEYKKLPKGEKIQIIDPTHGESGAHMGAMKLLPGQYATPEGRQGDGQLRETQSMNIWPKKSSVPQKSCPGCKPLNAKYGYTDNMSIAHPRTVAEQREFYKDEKGKVNAAGGQWGDERRKATQLRIMRWANGVAEETGTGGDAADSLGDDLAGLSLS